MININSKTTQFLLKLINMKRKNPDDIKVNEFVRKQLLEYNLRVCPNPEYLGQTELIKIYGKLLNWRKVETWDEQKLVRKIPVKYLATVNNTLYNENNPSHVEKGFRYGYYFAKEDFVILIQNDQLQKKSKLKIKEIETANGTLGIYRDFRRLLPDLKETENLADSYATFVAFLAQEKIKEELSKQNFTPEEVEKFRNFLDNVIPVENISIGSV